MHRQSYWVRILKFIAGLAITAVGISFTVQANIGTEPWSVLHQGISLVTGISFGNATAVVGAVAIALGLLLGEKIGVGTIGNIVLTAPMLDAIFASNLVPLQHTLWGGLIMMVIGLELIPLGTWLYMDSELGAGPRDALSVGLAKLTHRSTGFCRSSMEVIATVVGFIMGGQLGIGTLVAAIGIGILFQLNFKLLHFDPTKLQQENLRDTWNVICGHKKAKQ